MKQGTTLFLKIVLCLMAIAALAAMVWFPQAEGRAANLDWFGIYSDPFILYGYLASVPFFVALYQAFILLRCIEQNKAFSRVSVDSLRIIKYCAIAIIGFIAGGEAYIVFFSGGDDFAGPVVVGIFATFSTFVVAVFAAVLQKLFQNALDIKSENELTV